MTDLAPAIASHRGDPVALEFRVRGSFQGSFFAEARPAVERYPSFCTVTVTSEVALQGLRLQLRDAQRRGHRRDAQEGLRLQHADLAEQVEGRVPDAHPRIDAADLHLAELRVSLLPAPEDPPGVVRLVPAGERDEVVAGELGVVVDEGLLAGDAELLKRSQTSQT